MSTTLIVPLLAGSILVIAASACVVMAPRLPAAIRIVAALVPLALGVFCVFGFFAAMEPGNYHVVWRVGYASLFVACLLAIGRLALAEGAIRSSDEAPED